MISNVLHEGFESLDLVPTASGDGFIVKHDFRVWFDYGGFRYELIVPAGFHTDLSSIPGLGRFFWKTWGKHTVGSVVHDCWYAYRLLSKTVGDELMLDIFVGDKVNWFQRNVFYSFVTMFGSHAWESEDMRPDRVVLKKLYVVVS